jgi:hypothetical protein
MFYDVIIVTCLLIYFLISLSICYFGFFVYLIIYSLTLQYYFKLFILFLLYWSIKSIINITLNHVHLY